MNEIVARLVADLRAAAETDDVLDELVCDVACEGVMGQVNATDDEDKQEEIIGGAEEDASIINNRGWEGQLEYLLAQGLGEAEIRKAISLE
jgi:cytochrome P450